MLLSVIVPCPNDCPGLVHAKGDITRGMEGGEEIWTAATVRGGCTLCNVSPQTSPKLTIALTMAFTRAYTESVAVTN